MRLQKLDSALRILALGGSTALALGILVVFIWRTHSCQSQPKDPPKEHKEPLPLPPLVPLSPDRPAPPEPIKPPPLPILGPWKDELGHRYTIVKTSDGLELQGGNYSGVCYWDGLRLKVVWNGNWWTGHYFLSKDGTLEGYYYYSTPGQRPGPLVPDTWRKE